MKGTQEQKTLYGFWALEGWYSGTKKTSVLEKINFASLEIKKGGVES